MIPALLALALAVADPLGFPSPPVALPATAATAPAAPPAAATIPAARPVALTLPASAGPGLDALILPVAALLALALAALFATRRRKRVSRLVQVLETTSIGPKRALVVARVGAEILVIGASEAGLQLLAARPAEGEERLADPPTRLAAVPDPAPAPATDRRPALGLLARLRALPGTRRSDPAPEPSGFEALLAESTEDQELRRKLALGQSGSIR